MIISVTDWGGYKDVNFTGAVSLTNYLKSIYGIAFDGERVMDVEEESRWVGTLIGTASGTFWMLLGSLLNLAGFACYVLCIYRMFSRNLTKRQAENRRFESACARSKTQLRQAKNRFKNRKQYKYFRCPGCRQQLRAPRGRGKILVTCQRCHKQFKQKT